MAHEAHEVAAAAALNLPALQLEQVAPPASVWKVPAAHAVQLVAPTAENRPAAHERHLFPLKYWPDLQVQH